MCGLDIDAVFWGNDKCCDCGFFFMEFNLWEKKLPYGFKSYSAVFVCAFNEAAFGEELGKFDEPAGWKSQVV